MLDLFAPPSVFEQWREAHARLKEALVKHGVGSREARRAQRRADELFGAVKHQGPPDVPDETTVLR